MPLRQFASDNQSGICPEALAALTKANTHHTKSYGDDPWTAAAADALRALFAKNAEDAQVFFVFNGTAANSLALASLCQSYQSVLCHQAAHIETDECGAPEFFSNGAKLLPIPGLLAKLDPAMLEAAARKRTDIHFPKPRAVSLTQTTELGTNYSLAELRALRDVARRCGLAVHMDGARFANAVAGLNVHPREIIEAAGVDVLCFGGTKNGLFGVEAVIYFNTALAQDFEFRCKQAGQLSSKMRFMAAQWLGILTDDIWLKNARHANAMAAKLETRLREIPQAKVLYPRDANAVFVEMPADIVENLRKKGWIFYSFIGGGCRLMCSWDTQESDIEELVRDVRGRRREDEIADTISD